MKWWLSVGTFCAPRPRPQVCGCLRSVIYFRLRNLLDDAARRKKGTRLTMREVTLIFLVTRSGLLTSSALFGSQFGTMKGSVIVDVVIYTHLLHQWDWCSVIWFILIGIIFRTFNSNSRFSGGSYEFRSNRCWYGVTMRSVESTLTSGVVITRWSLTWPACASWVVLMNVCISWWNLPRLDKPLPLTASAWASVYKGGIRVWNLQFSLSYQSVNINWGCCSFSFQNQKR